MFRVTHTVFIVFNFNRLFEKTLQPCTYKSKVYIRTFEHTDCNTGNCNTRYKKKMRKYELQSKQTVKSPFD